MKDTRLSRCWRCGGLMVRERFYDWMSDNGRLDFQGVRCLICGEIVDPLIVAHRHERSEPPNSQRRQHWPRRLVTRHG